MTGYDIMLYCITDIQAIGTDFVFGYIQCMDGEKDPRNLVIAFNCVSLIARNITLGKLQ